MKTLPALVTLCIALSAYGCDGMLKGKMTAERSIAEFHKLYHDGSLAEIYSATHPKFKEGTTQEKFIEFLSAVQRKLGKVTHTVNTGFNVEIVNITTILLVTQKTTFERSTATESFTFQVELDRAVLVHYNIDSPDLILR